MYEGFTVRKGPFVHPQEVGRRQGGHAPRRDFNVYLRNVRWYVLCYYRPPRSHSSPSVAFGLRHNLDAFIFYHGEGGAAKEFSDISYWVNIMKTVDYVMQTAIGDAILVGCPALFIRYPS